VEVVNDPVQKHVSIKAVGHIFEGRHIIIEIMVKHLSAVTIVCRKTVCAERL